MRVRISANLLRGFTKRAKVLYPMEYVELAYGRQVRNDFVILALMPPEQDANTGSVVWTEDEDTDTLDDSNSSPVLLGPIHSHPRENEASPSEFDWKAQRTGGYLIAGICAIWRKGEDGPLKSRVQFYLANALLDMEKS